MKTMEKLKRFDLDRTVARMFSATNGAWVKADDHLAMVKELEQRFAAVRPLVPEISAAPKEKP